ncbi:DUF3955 domain-containing protein [Clostridium sp.]|uniref:DUF3955 domain-containing protein n=1 Tax=Clostridium sp. TaxID=1506 RepID=UPI00321794BE
MKKYRLTLIPFVLSVACIIVYNIIGSEVAADGTLIEPFFLIPIGWLFFGIGIIAIIVIWALSSISRIGNTKKS